MRSRYSITQENKKLKRWNIILTLLVGAFGLIILYEVHNDDNVWNEGFTSCVEENNLYNRYPDYKGDGQWQTR